MLLPEAESSARAAGLARLGRKAGQLPASQSHRAPWKLPSIRLNPSDPHT